MTLAIQALGLGHEVGAVDCGSCTAEAPLGCICGGLVHAEEGADGAVILQCDGCTYREVRDEPAAGGGHAAPEESPDDGETEIAMRATA